MSSNTTTSQSLVGAYYPFTLMIVGTSLNFLTFVILCRPTFRDTKKQPIIHYMRTIAIFDILMLYGWNLDHYLSIVHGFALLTYSIATCKFFGFLSYFAAQSSAWLRVFICLDRYLSVSRLHRAWVSRGKGVLIIMACTITIITLFNFHFLIFACYYGANGIINPNARLYRIYPIWNHIHLIVYNCAPFLLMITFNSGAVHHLLHRREVQMIQHSRIDHRAISITLVTTTFLFLVMTIPATVAAAFFSTKSPPVLQKVLDSTLYTYHITSFPLYFITFKEFRRECFRVVTSNKHVGRIGPALAVAVPINT